MSRSPLHNLHEDLGCRFVDFDGWVMPVQYSSVLQEHKAVRSSAGFFDVSHLGRFELTGPGAKKAVRRLFCNDVQRIEPGRAQYTMMLNESGGVIDDIIVWWWEDDLFWVLPNAANHERVMDAFSKEPDCAVKDIRPSTVMIAVQGPDAPEIIEDVIGEAPARFRLARSRFRGRDISMGGTGYTGEAGGELCTDPETGHQLIEALVGAGVTPCGLGARDTLRLEAGLPLWGEDLDETTTPLEAGLRFAVSLDHEFAGRNVLVKQAQDGLPRLLVGFMLEERKIPRQGHPVRTQAGTGEVTSGNISPMLNTGVGLAYVSPPPGSDEETMEVEIRKQWVPGRIVKPPFHTA
jgi:aminomethyltransferase